MQSLLITKLQPVVMGLEFLGKLNSLTWSIYKLSRSNFKLLTRLEEYFVPNKDNIHWISLELWLKRNYLELRQVRTTTKIICLKRKLFRTLMESRSFTDNIMPTSNLIFTIWFRAIWISMGSTALRWNSLQVLTWT